MGGMSPLIAYLLLALSPQDELQRIDAKGLEETVKFLASDELQGRSTGTPENELAARFLAKRFEEIGLEPAVGETYLQSVPLRHVGEERAAELDVYISVEDFGTHAAGVWFDPIGAATSTDKLSVLTVEGIEDIPLEADADVALFLSGSSRVGRKWLTERGHEGGAGWGAVISRGSKRNGRPWVKRDPRLVRVATAKATEEATEENPTPWMRVHGETRAAFENGRVQFIQLRTYPIEEEVPAHNVVGLIQGVGTKDRPLLAEEVVVLTAHFDHIGVSNFEIEDLKAVQAAATKPIAMNQFETHPYYQRHELLAYCGEHGILAGVTLARGEAFDGADRNALIGDALTLAPSGQRRQETAVEVGGVSADMAPDLLEIDRGQPTAVVGQLFEPVLEAQVAHAAAVVAA